MTENNKTNAVNIARLQKHGHVFNITRDSNTNSEAEDGDCTGEGDMKSPNGENLDHFNKNIGQVLENQIFDNKNNSRINSDNEATSDKLTDNKLPVSETPVSKYDNKYFRVRENDTKDFTKPGKGSDNEDKKGDGKPDIHYTYVKKENFCIHFDIAKRNMSDYQEWDPS